MEVPSEARVLGRDRELALLRSALSDAVAGRGRLLLISGEPGIGKSTLAAVLAADAAAQRLLVSTARAPETRGAPPYWLWTQIVRDYLAPGGPVAVSQLPAARRQVIARILPEVHASRRGGAASRPAEGESERFRLADEITSFLLERAVDGCRLVILDDLHAADASSLEVLAHVATRLAAAPLLIVCAFRDVADESTSALQALLARAAREESTLALRLTGLDANAVRRQLAAIMGREVDPELAARVHLRTGGNPFFAAEVARLLARDAAGVAIPPRVRDVIRGRLGRIPEETRDVLDRAALIGQEVPIDTLATACGLPAETVLRALEPAVGAALIREGGTAARLRFAHALIAETIVEALPLGRAAALHEAVASAIESTRSADLDDWLPALVLHWSAAVPSDHATLRTLEVARLAAEQAEERMAFGDAMPLWRTALEAAGRIGSDPAERTELRLGLGRSLFRAGDVAGAVEACTHAALEAESASRPDLGAAAALVVEGVSEPQSAAAMVALAERALSLLEDEETALRARLHAQIAQLIHLTSAGTQDRERHETVRAVALAESSGDLQALQAALRAQQLIISGPLEVELRLHNAARMIQIGKASDDPWPDLWGRLWSFDALMQLGRLGEAEVELGELEAVVARIRWPVARWHLLRALAAVLQVRGRFDEALEAADRALAQISGAGLDRAEGMHTTFLERQADLVGELRGGEEHLRLLRELVVREPHVTVRGVASLLRRGLLDEASALYARLPPPNRWNPPPYVLAVPLAERLKAAISLQLRDEVEQLLPRLEPFARWHLVFGSGVALSLGSGYLYTGMAAGYLGDFERGVAEITRAVEDNQESGARAMSVVARQELAQVLERRNSGSDLDRARRLASAVIQDAQRMGMRPSVSRASALLARLPRRLGRSEELTPRELEVARLITEGLTNRQLAARLGISERTAENHVDHILSKLGFAGRAQVAAWVVASGRT